MNIKGRLRKKLLEFAGYFEELKNTNSCTLKAMKSYSTDGCTLLKKFKGAHTLWQIAVKTDIPSFDTKIQKN